MRRPRLSSEEQLLVQAAFDLFAKTREWPTFGQVEHALVRQLDDVERTALRLHRRYDVFPAYLQPSSELRLTPELVLKCEGYDEAYAPLVRALPVFLDVYLNNPEKPEARSSHFLERGWPPKEVGELGMLLRDGAPFGGSRGWSGDGSWHVDLQPSVRRYGRCTSAEEYLTLHAKARRSHRRK